MLNFRQAPACRSFGEKGAPRAIHETQHLASLPFSSAPTAQIELEHFIAHSFFCTSGDLFWVMAEESLV